MSKKLGVNPWISILTRPRDTIKVIVGFNPNYRIFILSSIVGFFSILGIGQQLQLGKRLDLILIIIPAIILSPLWGYILYSFSSWFVFFTGRWIKGAAKYREVRASMLWAGVPLIVVDIFYIFLIIIGGVTFFRGEGKFYFFPFASVLVVLLAVLSVVAVVWSFVIYLNTLSAVQKFSRWRAFGNMLLAWVFKVLFLFVLSFFIGIILKYACSPFFDQPKLVKIVLESLHIF